MEIKKFIRIFFILFPAFIFPSCGNSNNSICIKNWSMLPDNTDSAAAVTQESGWVPIEIPFQLKVPCPKEKDFSFFWLKGEFSIDTDPDSFSGLSSGRIKFSDETYINNKLIESTSCKTVNWAPLPRNYNIPEGILKNGKNTVLIRLGVYDKYFGGILGDVSVQPKNEFIKNQFINNFIYRLLPFGIVILFLGMTITMLITYFWNRKDKLYIFSTLPLIISIFYIYLPYLEIRILSFELNLAIEYCLSSIFFIIFLLLIQSVYRIFLSNYNMFFVPLMLILIIIVFLFRNGPYNQLAGNSAVILSVLSFIPVFILMMKRLYLINPDRFLYISEYLSFFILLFIIISETYWSIFGGIHSELLSTFAPLLFIIIGTAVTSRELNKRRKDLEIIYNKLKNYTDREIKVTDINEIKLNKVIEFIKENYTSNLSRDGLASAVEIHPGYLGKLFKLYTDKSINEYIQKLRVDKAIKLLEDGDTKIIDIAYHVGFESLVTFNRVFKKTTGKTPSNYKNDL